jgi:hypothetical protein
MDKTRATATMAPLVHPAFIFDALRDAAIPVFL